MYYPSVTVKAKKVSCAGTCSFMPRDGIGYERTLKKFCSCAHATSSMRMESVDDCHPPMFSKYNFVNIIGAQDLCVSNEKTRLTDSNKGNFEDILRTYNKHRLAGLGLQSFWNQRLQFSWCAVLSGNQVALQLHLEHLYHISLGWLEICIILKSTCPATLFFQSSWKQAQMIASSALSSWASKYTAKKKTDLSPTEKVRTASRMHWLELTRAQTISAVFLIATSWNRVWKCYRVLKLVHGNTAGISMRWHAEVTDKERKGGGRFSAARVQLLYAM